ncbi:hypothetical protein [Pseudomonas sp. O230]|uniref:hypothetical protein n=1 Tax=Pseudomonas sp. O230 TaxID=3159450 RepID=UPI00387B5591
METKHTPGPWSYWSGYNPLDKIEAQVTAEDGDIVIASYNHLIAEGEANAKLMAAAPELLGALIESRQVIATALKVGAPDWFDTDDKVAQHATVKKIDAAIARATA